MLTHQEMVKYITENKKAFFFRQDIAGAANLLCQGPHLIGLPCAHLSHKESSCTILGNMLHKIFKCVFCRTILLHNHRGKSHTAFGVLVRMKCSQMHSEQLCWNLESAPELWSF